MYNQRALVIRRTILMLRTVLPFAVSALLSAGGLQGSSSQRPAASDASAKNDKRVQKGGAALSANQRLGTWKLNVAKSTFGAGRAAKSALQTAEMVGDSIKVTNEATTEDGRTLKYGYTAKYDGKDYPFPGSPWDTIALELIDAFTSKAVFKRGGKVVQTTNITVSQDGKLLTLATSGVDTDGKSVSYREVFDRH